MRGSCMRIPFKLSTCVALINAILLRWYGSTTSPLLLLILLVVDLPKDLGESQSQNNMKGDNIKDTSCERSNSVLIFDILYNNNKREE